MDIPYYVDSDDADSLPMSENTMIMNEEAPDVRTCASINPDNLDVDLYLDELVLSPMGTPEPEPHLSPKKPIPRSKATTIDELEDELVECVCSNGSVFHILYLLHEHFAKSKTITANDKATAKGRIMTKIRGKASAESIEHITPILTNFFN